MAAAVDGGVVVAGGGGGLAAVVVPFSSPPHPATGSAKAATRMRDEPGHSWNSPRATTTALPATSTRSICSGVPQAVA